MIVWCDKENLIITSDIAPQTTVCKPLPSDDEETRKYKKKFPYLNKKRVLFDVTYFDKQYCILIDKGFRWNGTNCLGLQHNPKLLDASCFHDLLCNKHYLIDNDRQLSSLIFREMGIASGVWKPFMYGAYHAVDNYQKVWGKDLQGRKWSENG